MPTYTDDSNSVCLTYNARRNLITVITCGNVTLYGLKSIAGSTMPLTYTNSGEVKNNGPRGEIRLSEELTALPSTIDAKIYVDINGNEYMIWSGQLAKVDSKMWHTP